MRRGGRSGRGAQPLKAGKLPVELLARCLKKIRRDDERVVLWPEVGEDAAAIAFGERLLVATTDPITFAADLIGWYAVHINANDVAVCGATPRWLMAAILLPEGADSALAEDIFDQILRGCAELGVTLVGGHTEITAQVARAVVVGCMVGEVEPERLVRSAGAQPGDILILTKGIAVEGTALLAREAADDLRAHGVGEDTLRRGRELLFSPGISIVPEARMLAQTGGVHAMHDPTEGGLATGLEEMATAGGHGIRVREDAVPVLAECREVCDALGLDPLGLIASGALLAALAPSAAQGALASLAHAGIAAAIIGEVTPQAEGLVLERATGRRPLPHFERDEVARYFASD